MDENGYPQGNVQENKIFHTDKQCNSKPEYFLENEAHQSIGKFEIKMDQEILVKTPNLVLIEKKKIIRYLVYFVVPVVHWVKMKEIEKTDKKSDVARELNWLWNMRVMVLSSIIGAFGTVHKDLEKE